MYSKYWIEKYGYTELLNHIRNNDSIKLSSHNEEEVRFSFALENFLVKNMHVHNKDIDRYIDELFEAFSYNPINYAYSYILSNGLVVDSIVNNNDKRKKLFYTGIKKLTVGWKNTFNKVMNDEPVNINDKNKLLTLFIFGVRNDNEKQMKTIEKYIKKLLNDNKIPDNDLDKLLLFNYASRKTLGDKYKMVDTFIKLADIERDDDYFLGGYENDAFIVMNDHPSDFSFYESLDQMIQCVCHETTHSIQKQQAINEPNNVHAMEMAIQELFGFDEYQTGDNYLFNEIEEDAQRNGYWQASLIYQMAGRHDLSQKLFKEKINYLKNRRFQYEYVTVNENGKEQKFSKEKYNVVNIRKIIKDNPKLIRDYPVLSNIFDNNGNPKSLEKMLSEDFKSHDIREMYTDFIIYDIRHDGLDDIDLSNKNDKEKYNILHNLCNIITSFADKTRDIIRDYDYRCSHNKKTKFFYKVSLEDFIRLANYIEKEMPWMRKYESKNPGNYSLYTSYTMALRYLLNVIDGFKAEGKLTNLEEETNEHKDDLDRLETNMKREYINYLLEHFTHEERNTILSINNKIITLEAFIRFEVSKHMDRDHNLYSDSGSLIVTKEGYAEKPLSFIREVYDRYKANDLMEMLRNANKNDESSTSKRVHN